MYIRRLAPADAIAFQALHLDGLRDSPSAFTASLKEESEKTLDQFETRLAPETGSCYFGAFDGETLIAIGRLDRDSSHKQWHRAHIRGLFVAAAHRGKGAARKLMEHALDFAATLQGVTHVSLAVTAGNESAQRLYESLGFKAWGREPAALMIDGVPYDEIPMTKTLAHVRPEA
jgi:ribosomal protein S18 acetylase RimI-like enzyme